MGSQAIADEAPVAPQETLGTIHIHEDPPEPVKSFEILKTEVIGKQAIEHKRAQTLADAVAGQAGIDAQNSCANCGSKRITINGLRGEHTTVLIDGVPMHSSVSSFYGMDAIPVVGIDSIEISRGAGASLIAPEAIGGVINIITHRPTQTGMSLQGSLGQMQTHLFSILGSAVSDSGKHRLTLAGQLSDQGHWDVDGNYVSEAPNLANRSFFLKGMSDLTPADKVEARYSRQTVGILGGTVDGTRPATPLPVVDTPQFEGDDTSRRYLDAQDKLTDVVDLARHEGMVRWNHFFKGESQVQLTSSLTEQKQTSIYMHGYDYANRDLLFFNDARVLFPLGTNHFITFGLELKNQDMASESQTLYVDRVPSPLPKDDFSYRSRAAYLQDVWLINESVELSAALRLDGMRVNWKSQTVQEFEIDRTLLAPRAHLKVLFGPLFTWRLMYGRGYRPPLSFFESQHGLGEEGFKVEINDLELSHSAGSSLTFAKSAFSATFSSHVTFIRGVAFAQAEAGPDGEAVFRNHPDEFRIWANDLVLSWNPLPNWNLQLGYERFSLPDGYKAILPAAAVEQRARLVSDLHVGSWEFVNTFTWIGARNLSQYGYNQHYRTLEREYYIPGDPSFGFDYVVNQPKGQWAPGFVTWDLYLGWTLKNKYTFFGQVQNVLGFTQTGAGDSPLNWASHGGDPKHFHLDNNHVWGPLKGRLISVGLKVEL